MAPGDLGDEIVRATKSVLDLSSTVKEVFVSGSGANSDVWIPKKGGPPVSVSTTGWGNWIKCCSYLFSAFFSMSLFNTRHEVVLSIYFRGQNVGLLLLWQRYLMTISKVIVFPQNKQVIWTQTLQSILFNCTPVSMHFNGHETGDKWFVNSTVVLALRIIVVTFTEYRCRACQGDQFGRKLQLANSVLHDLRSVHDSKGSVSLLIHIFDSSRLSIEKRLLHTHTHP